MKKTVSFFLAAVVLFSLCSCAQTTKIPAGQTAAPEPAGEPSAVPAGQTATAPAPEASDDGEVRRAVAYGFVPAEIQGDWDKPVTFRQFCSMLRDMLSLYDGGLVPKWEETASRALASDDAMHRDHGMLAVYYAACLMGMGRTTNGNWNYMAQNLGVEAVNGFDGGYEKWFPDCGSEAPFYDIDYKHRIAGWDFVTCSRYWCMGQTSRVSGNTVFDIDFENKTVRPMDDLSRKDAIRAALRLYESTFEPAEKPASDDAKSAEILALAENRRSRIISSETAVVKGGAFVQGKTYTGTAYYVSNGGKDTNDGRSLEKAWATMDKVNSAKLKYGDAVFFRRGDIWHDQLWGRPGVTYSAYGEGPKPVISGSVAENAADAGKWKLYRTGAGGEKIWVYYRDLRDCSGIFFNGGESWANKATPFWDGKQYVTETGESFDAATGLTENLDYFSCVDLSRIDPLDKVMETGATGPLYLRCDGGNPGELYGSIDFALDGTGISPADCNGKDMTVDNIKVVFFGMLGISCAGDQGWSNVTVQNCEIGWCGGCITSYSYELKDGLAVANISGGALHMTGSDKTATNNYIHHCASKTVVIALHDGTGNNFFSNTTIQGNLLEYNAAALHLADYMEQENPAADSGFKNIRFDDNIVMYTGYGWVDTKTRRTDYWLERLPFSSVEFGGQMNNKNEGIYITNNIFYLSKYVLVHCYMPKDNQPVFSGNTYAQGENGWLAMLRGRLLSVTENGEKYVRDELSDGTGTLLTVR